VFIAITIHSVVFLVMTKYSTIKSVWPISFWFSLINYKTHLRMVYMNLFLWQILMKLHTWTPRIY